MIISLIAAVAKNGVIGKGNELPWRLSADLKYFKKVTMGKPILMGRKTHESIGRALPGRLNIVMTGQPDFSAPGCEVVSSMDEVLKAAEGAGELMVIGGASIYTLLFDQADRLYLTRLDKVFEGDTFFPEFNEAPWEETFSEIHEDDKQVDFSYTFKVLNRKKDA